MTLVSFFFFNLFVGVIAFGLMVACLSAGCPLGYLFEVIFFLNLLFVMMILVIGVCRLFGL